MPFFGQQVFLDAQSTGGKVAQVYLDAKPRVFAFAYTDNILQVLEANDLAILISPSEDQAWLTNHSTGDSYSGASSSTYPAAAGAPHLTVPMGSVSGLPVGMSFYGRRFDDARVLAIGYAYEQQRGVARTAAEDYGEAPTMRLPHTATIGR
jgi:amidase